MVCLGTHKECYNWKYWEWISVKYKKEWERSHWNVKLFSHRALTCKISLLIPTAMLSCWPGCWGWLFSTGPGSDNSRSCWMTSVTVCWPWWAAAGDTWFSVCWRSGDRKCVAWNIQRYVCQGRSDVCAMSSPVQLPYLKYLLTVHYKDG